MRAHKRPPEIVQMITLLSYYYFNTTGTITRLMHHYYNTTNLIIPLTITMIAIVQVLVVARVHYVRNLPGTASRWGRDRLRILSNIYMYGI